MLKVLNPTLVLLMSLNYIVLLWRWDRKELLGMRQLVWANLERLSF